jgi:hypothetical protein
VGYDLQQFYFVNCDPVFGKTSKKFPAQFFAKASML